MKKNKTKMLIAIISVLVAGIACYVLLMFPEIFEPSAHTTPSEDRIDVNNFFYDADFSKELEDYENYEEYMGFDRYVHYKDGALTLAVQDSNRDTFDTDVLFFCDYFDIIISGDHEKYNSLFTAKFFETHDKKEPFTPQMLYDILIEKLSEKNEGGVTTCAFDVSYRIFENNGTFRDDIYSDAIRTIYVEIDNSEGSYKISNIMYYTVE